MILGFSYIGAHLKVYEYYSMKQKSQLQMGIAQFKNPATPLRTRGINTTHQHFQMRYIYNFDLSQGAQKLFVKVEM